MDSLIAVRDHMGSGRTMADMVVDMHMGIQADALGAVVAAVAAAGKIVVVMVVVEN